MENRGPRRFWLKTRRCWRGLGPPWQWKVIGTIHRSSWNCARLVCYDEVHSEAAHRCSFSFLWWLVHSLVVSDGGYQRGCMPAWIENALLMTTLDWSTKVPCRNATMCVVQQGWGSAPHWQKFLSEGWREGVIGCVVEWQIWSLPFSRSPRTRARRPLGIAATPFGILVLSKCCKDVWV